jgi:competence protein ComEA
MSRRATLYFPQADGPLRRAVTDHDAREASVFWDPGAEEHRPRAVSAPRRIAAKLRAAHKAAREFMRARWAQTRDLWPSLLRFGVRAALACVAIAVLVAIGSRGAAAVAPSGFAGAAPALLSGAIADRTASAMAIAGGAQANTDAPLGTEEGVLTMPAMTIVASGGDHDRATPEHPVFINDATLEDLERLPGIGPKKAAGILQLRARLGRFRRVEDLMRVKGIGAKAIIKLRPVVRLDGPVDAALRDAGPG